MRALFLAADGGNSKTDIVLGTADGEVLGFVRGPTTSPHVVGLPRALEMMGHLVRTARREARLDPQTTVDLIAVYLAGADLPVEVERLQAAVAAQHWAARSVVDNDCFALMRSGTSMPDAIAVVCGAGNNCVGRSADGRTARFPALGPISGDWGGGHDLAEHTLRLAARGEDGRGTRTALSAAVARHFGRPTVEAVSIALHLGELAMESIHELTPVLFEVGATGDEVAGDLIRQQVGEILAHHRVAADRLGLRDAPHALVLGGGVLRAQHPQLHDQVVAGARALAPRVEISVPNAPPVVGAALLAVDILGTAAVAESRLRTAMNRTPVPAPTLAPGPDAQAPTIHSWTVSASPPPLDGHAISLDSPAVLGGHADPRDGQAALDGHAGPLEGHGDQRNGQPVQGRPAVS
jgi:N-acetylglucosamine kinase-like BadF-type ATPase